MSLPLRQSLYAVCLSCKALGTLRSLPVPVPVCPKTPVQMQAHYVARLLSQHGLELPSKDLLQKASGIQTRSSVSMPDGLEVDARAMRSMQGPFGGSKSAELPPSCHRSQDDQKVSFGTSSF